MCGDPVLTQDSGESSQVWGLSSDKDVSSLCQTELYFGKKLVLEILPHVVPPRRLTSPLLLSELKDIRILFSPLQ